MAYYKLSDEPVDGEETWSGFSNLTVFGIVGVLLLGIGIFCLNNKWLKRLVFVSGVGLLVFVLGCIAYTLMASPGHEDVVDIDKQPQPSPIPKNRLEPLLGNWNSAEYPNWPVTELLALLCEKAYLTPFEAKASFKEIGFSSTEDFVDSSMIGYVVTSDKATVIVFRGSEDKADWFVNLNAFSSATSHGDIHKGFFNAYQGLKPQILKLLQTHHRDHLWITGHSLGGALAIICAYDLAANENYDIDGVITFGQPMVAHQQLADYIGEKLSGRYAHYVNESDIVARVAPGYSHCGSLIWFTNGGIKQTKPKRMLVGATEKEKGRHSREEAARPLSDMEFKQLKDDLQNGSEKRRVFGATEKSEVIPIEEEDFHYLNEGQFKEVKADLKEEMAPAEQSPDGKRIVKGKISWLQDHFMQQYLDKIHSYWHEGNGIEGK